MELQTATAKRADIFEAFIPGDIVMATARISEWVEEEEVIYARPHDLGRVIGHEIGCLPTVRWIQSGLVCDVSTDSAVRVSGEA